MNSITLLRSLCIAGMKVLKANPELSQVKGGEELVQLLDEAKAFLDASHGFSYSGEVELRGACLKLLDLNKDFDDVIRVTDKRLNSNRTYTYPSIINTSASRESAVSAELSFFVVPNEEVPDGV